MRIDWENTQVQLLSAGKYLSQKGVTVDPTWKYWMYTQTLWYVWTGRANIELPEGRTSLRPGTCLWLRPGFEYRHTQDPNRPLGMYSIHFDLVMADGQRRSAGTPLPPEQLSPVDSAYVERIMERLAGANPEGFIWGWAMAPLVRKQMTCLLTGLLMELDAATTDKPSSIHREPPHIAHINDIARRILEDPSQFDSVINMARELHYSTAYFSRLFRKIRAFSPNDALVLSRIRHAAHMLLETRLPIKAIAERLGYRDVYFFSRQFRRYMHMPPATYRKNPPKRRP